MIQVDRNHEPPQIDSKGLPMMLSACHLNALARHGVIGFCRRHLQLPACIDAERHVDTPVGLTGHRRKAFQSHRVPLLLIEHHWNHHGGLIGKLGFHGLRV